MASLVNDLYIHSDGPGNLLPACQIATSWHPRITHYAVSKSDEGTDALHLYWTGNFTPPAGIVVHQLPFTLSGQNSNSLFTFVLQWLLDLERDYGPEPGGDGTAKKGWLMEATSEAYEVCKVTALWNYYGK